MKGRQRYLKGMKKLVLIFMVLLSACEPELVPEARQQGPGQGIGDGIGLREELGQVAPAHKYAAPPTADECGVRAETAIDYLRTVVSQASLVRLEEVSAELSRILGNCSEFPVPRHRVCGRLNEFQRSNLGLAPEESPDPVPTFGETSVGPPSDLEPVGSIEYRNQNVDIVGQGINSYCAGNLNPEAECAGKWARHTAPRGMQVAAKLRVYRGLQNIPSYVYDPRTPPFMILDGLVDISEYLKTRYPAECNTLRWDYDGACWTAFCGPIYDDEIVVL